jgi:hypothetical protein
LDRRRVVNLIIVREVINQARGLGFFGQERAFIDQPADLVNARSLSQGRAGFSMEPAGFREVPEGELEERGLVWR